MMRLLRLAALSTLTVLVTTACLGATAPTAAVGECLQVSDLGDQIDSLPQVPCEDPHEAEVYHVFEIEGDGAYDFNTVVTTAQEACIAEFTGFVGLDYWESDLDIYFLHPVAAGWEEGDREVLCAVIAPDWSTADNELTMVTGTLEGAAR